VLGGDVSAVAADAGVPVSRVERMAIAAMAILAMSRE